MVTGDTLETATAIAKDAGILPQDYKDIEGRHYVMEGKNFRE